MVKIAVVYHSLYGHTKLQAEAVLSGVRRVAGVEAEVLTVQEATEKMDRLDSMDAIIFGSPTYMGSLSAEMKKFLEAAAVKWFSQAWKDKIAGAFTNSSSFSGDKLNTLMGLVINAMQHGMIYVGLGMLPSASNMDAMNRIEGPGPDEHNRVGRVIWRAGGEDHRSVRERSQRLGFEDVRPGSFSWAVNSKN
jgi:NAD(P)H dehydrogenase (quinone)